MNRFTPGVWDLVPDPDHFDTLSTIVAGEKETRKGISQRMIVQVGGWADLKEQEANARLIHAAPFLLEALRTLKAEWINTIDGEWGKGAGEEWLPPIVEHALGLVENVNS